MLKKVAWFLMMGWMPMMGYAGVAVSPKPYVLFSIGGFPITNGMLYTWIVSLCIIAIVYALVGRPRMIPSKGQVVVESLIDGVYQLMAPITGKRVIRMAFPLLIGYFIYTEGGVLHHVLFEAALLHDGDARLEFLHVYDDLPPVFLRTEEV